MLTKNLEALQKYQPETYKKIIEYISKDHKIHRYNFVDVSQKWYDWYMNGEIKACIIYGIGNGCNIRKTLECQKGIKIVVCEPDISLFAYVIKHYDISDLMGKVILVLEDVPDALEHFYQYMWHDKNGVILCVPDEEYTKLYPEPWEFLRSKFEKMSQVYMCDVVTQKFFGKVWIHNYIKNLKRLPEFKVASSLCGRFKNVPGIVVSAGPSLERNVHLLKGMENSCVIIAAGTAVISLEEYGVKPHFMIGIDAMVKETERFNAVKNDDIYMLYSNQISPSSLNCKQRKFWMPYTADGYSINFMNYIRMPMVPFLSGPSVSNTAMDVVCKLGCNPVVLVGQDLSFIDKEYAGTEANKHTFYEDEKIPEKDIYGNDVFTRSDYIAIRNFFEAQVKESKEVYGCDLYNCTEGGIAIEGLQNVTLKSVFDKYKPVPSNVTGIIDEVYEKGKWDPAIYDAIKDYETEIKYGVDELDHIIDSTDDSIITDMLIRSPLYGMLFTYIVELPLFFIRENAKNELEKESSLDKRIEIGKKYAKEQRKVIKECFDLVREYIG